MASLQGEIELEMRIEMLLERLIPYKSHATDATVELDSFEDFDLCDAFPITPDLSLPFLREESTALDSSRKDFGECLRCSLFFGR